MKGGTLVESQQVMAAVVALPAAAAAMRRPRVDAAAMWRPRVNTKLRSDRNIYVAKNLAVTRAILSSWGHAG